MTVLTHKLLILITALGLLLGWAAPNSHAYSIAVIPVADLTHERDGVNFALTEQLEEQLRQQGFAVIDQNRVIGFMVAERIRRCGEIDSFSARKMADHLGSDTVLLTTVYQQEKATDQSSIIVTLLHGKTGQTIWSTMLAGHLNDSQPIFGIRGDHNLSTLQNQQLVALAQQLAEQRPILPEQSFPELAAVQIDDIQIKPPLVKGGGSLKCQLKIDFLKTPPDRVMLQGGAQSVTLRPTATPHVYAATLTSKMADGGHNIDLTLNWPNGGQTSITDISTYHVANTPAQLSLSFYNSMKVGDAHAFSDEIKIRPRMAPNRPLELWRITIRDNQGEKVFSETQYTALPVEMIWRGINKNQRHLGTGYYTLTLTVRDIAGNETRGTAKLYLQAETVEMVEVKQRIDRGRSQLELSAKDSVLIPVNLWRLTLETTAGLPLLSRKGVSLPATITLPRMLTRKDIVCHFVMQDKLGNSYTTETVQQEVKVKNGSVAQVEKKTSTWKSDF